MKSVKFHRTAVATVSELQLLEEECKQFGGYDQVDCQAECVGSNYGALFAEVEKA